MCRVALTHAANSPSLLRAAPGHDRLGAAPHATDASKACVFRVLANRRRRGRGHVV